jgi:hypothetical protein
LGNYIALNNTSMTSNYSRNYPHITTRKNIGPNDVEFGHTSELLGDITESSLREIDACKGTPGFLLISFILAITMILIIHSRYKK